MRSGKNDRYIFVEQVRLLVKHIPSMVWLTLLTGVVITLILVGRVDYRIPAQWFAGVAIYCAVRIWHYTLVKNKKITVDNVIWHGGFFVGFSFLSGFLWGVLGLILPITSDPYIMVLTAILLCGMVAGSVSFLSIYKLAYFAYAIPCVVPFAIRCIMSQQDTLVAIGVLLLMFLVINLFHSHLTQINVLNGIYLVLENKELIEKLKHEKNNAEEARKLADHNNAAKSRFLAAASHDLRQPLHAMGFFVEALKSEKSKAKINSLTIKIAKTSENLSNLLGSLLDISKIEAGVMDPQRSHFILNELLVETMQEFSDQAKDKSIDLNCQPCFHAVHSDREMLGRILRNLVSNALRYTDHGFVSITWEMAEGQVVLHVNDSGVGIAENFQKDIFREFFRVNTRENDASRGLGLGLSIVEGLSRLLGHELSLRSQIGVGTTFSIKLPPGHSGKVTYARMDQALLIDEVAVKVVILNNEDDARESISGILRKWGHEVEEFRSCSEVMAFLSSGNFTPDIIISDVKLCDADGRIAIMSIQKAINKKIPAIIMTGESRKEKEAKFRTNGFSILQKPVQPAKLRSMVSFLVQEK